ncbi:hypothetical protein AtubIFM54640_008091 [Aspergillus tubingensis]|nr:hypothetical protein AtubIFM54640_008091 [Aspergillus tubingensis]
MREIQEESVSTYRIDSPPPSHTSSPTSSPLPSSPLHPRHGIIQHQSDHTRPLHPRPFRVIIIGGSIAGLTLANCLAAAGIEYLVLEKHQSINALLGGLIGIAPTGARILDQLGIYDAVKDIGQEITVLRTGFPDGSGFNQTWVAEFEKRYGYGISVTSRQQLLEVLYTALGPSASETVHLGKEVTNIHHEGSGVKVLTRDGMTYFGDLVAGADGVHSIARSEMLRMAGGSASNEESELSAEYRIHVGLSCPVPTITPGEQIVRCYDGFAVFALCGKDGILGWFITEKLDRRYQYPNRPNHTQNDAIKFCESLADVPVWGDVTFGAIWKARTSISHALVEENVFKTWNYGRICTFESYNVDPRNIDEPELRPRGKSSHGRRRCTRKQSSPTDIVQRKQALIATDPNGIPQAAP